MYFAGKMDIKENEEADRLAKQALIPPPPTTTTKKIPIKLPLFDLRLIISKFVKNR